MVLIRAHPKMENRHKQYNPVCPNTSAMLGHSYPSFLWPATQTASICCIKVDKAICEINLAIARTCINVMCIRLRYSMTSTAAPTFQSMIDEAGAGSTIVLKKGIYNIDGTLKINKELTIRAEDGCPHEVSKFTMIWQLMWAAAMNNDVFLSGCCD